MKLLVLTLLLGATAGAQDAAWGKLLDQGEIAEANKLCTQMTSSAALDKRVDAEKCLANVALAQGEVANLKLKDSRVLSLEPSYSEKAVNQALLHLNKGIELAPQDLSLHQGRLHVLEVSGRYTAMMAAMDQSATIYKGPDALDHWLAYDSELADMDQVKAGLAFAEVLNRHYPESHDVIGNIGAFHSMLQEYEAALPYLREAVALAPTDPLDAWNLGWALRKTGPVSEADKWMSRAIALEPVEKEDTGRNCLYAEFVESQLRDAARACKLEVASCAVDRQTACRVKAPAGLR